MLCSPRCPVAVCRAIMVEALRAWERSRARERERERERQRERRETERERDSERARESEFLSVCVCVRACVRACACAAAWGRLRRPRTAAQAVPARRVARGPVQGLSLVHVASNLQLGTCHALRMLVPSSRSPMFARRIRLFLFLPDALAVACIAVGPVPGLLSPPTRRHHPQRSYAHRPPSLAMDAAGSSRLEQRAVGGREAGMAPTARFRPSAVRVAHAPCIVAPSGRRRRLTSISRARSA